MNFKIKLIIVFYFVFLLKLEANNFGVEGGEGVTNGSEIISTVNQGGTPDLEIVLSYAMFTRNIQGISDINPFGHIALGINIDGQFKIITANQNATVGKDPLFFRLTPEDYFFRVSPLEHAVHGSHYGLAYARSSISIQLRGVPEVVLNRIKNRINQIDAEHASLGAHGYCMRSNNCAHLTSDLLEVASIIDKNDRSMFPVAVFNQALNYAKANSAVNEKMVFYQRIPSDHSYAYENIPVPANSFISTLFNMLGFNTLANIAEQATIVQADENRERLKITYDTKPNTRFKSCSKLWLWPFVAAILRRG